MIKVNLIPEEERKKVKRVKFRKPTISIPGLDMILAIVFLIVAAGALFFLNRTTSNRINELENQIDEARTELKELQKEEAIVENIQQRQQELSQWVSLVQDLNRGRALPVHVLNEINRVKPDYLWFVSFEESSNRFKITGKTFSNLIISNFMVNLKDSPYFSDIQLEEVNEGKEKEQIVMDFTISGNISSPGGG